MRRTWKRDSKGRFAKTNGKKASKITVRSKKKKSTKARGAGSWAKNSDAKYNRRMKEADEKYARSKKGLGAKYMRMNRRTNAHLNSSRGSVVYMVSKARGRRAARKNGFVA